MGRSPADAGSVLASGAVTTGNARVTAPAAALRAGVGGLYAWVTGCVRCGDAKAIQAQSRAVGRSRLFCLLSAGASRPGIRQSCMVNAVLWVLSDGGFL